MVRMCYFLNKKTNPQNRRAFILLSARQRIWLVELVKEAFVMGKGKSYKKLLISKDYDKGVDKLPMEEKYEEALEGNAYLIIKIIKSPPFFNFFKL